MTGNSTTTVNFSLEKETKGALRYQETDGNGQPVKIEGGAKIGTLYIRKSALNGEMPAKLIVTVASGA